MKTHALMLAALAALILPTAADTPDAILKDYRAKSAPALAKVNETLEKATVPIIADLVKAGDTTGAEELKAQLTAKQSGEPVMKPHAKAANLFTLFDAARLKAIDPAQKAAVARIDAMLAGSDGKKLEIVEELGQARAEIEAGKITSTSKIPFVWTYHQTPDGKPEAEVKFNPNGKFELGEGPKRTTGQWKQGKSTDTLEIDITGSKSVWVVSIKDDLATVIRPDVGTRYFRIKK